MSGDEYVKYVTENMLKYMFSTKEERKEIRETKKAKKEPFAFRWFGIIPLFISYLVKKRAKKLNHNR